MTTPERPSGRDRDEEALDVDRPPRYYPPDYGERLYRIEDRAFLARHVIAQQEERMPADVLAILRSDPNAEVDHLTVKSWRGARRREAAQQEAKRDLDTEARQFLLGLAEPFTYEPPEHEWSELPITNADGFTLVRIPFTADELDAILEAQDARQRLIAVSGRRSGAEREYVSHSPTFPDAVVSRGPFAVGLDDRRAAVTGIMFSARGAESVIRRNAVTTVAFEPQTIPMLKILRALPDKLVRHTPPAK